MMQARKPNDDPIEEAETWEVWALSIGIPIAIGAATWFVWLLYQVEVSL